MLDDPGVRSLRVALALCDRFMELTKGPNTIRAVKRNMDMFGVTGNETEMSLRLGEAQQIYPEIWSNLDDAAKAFRARGVDMAGYDTVRATERGIGANVDTRYAQHGSARYGYEEHTKTAAFNIAGIQRARVAADVIMK